MFKGILQHEGIVALPRADDDSAVWGAVSSVFSALKSFSPFASRPAQYVVVKKLKVLPSQEPDV